MQDNHYNNLPKHYDTYAILFGIAALCLELLPIIPIGLGITSLVFFSKAKKKLNRNDSLMRIGKIIVILAIIASSVYTIYWGISWIGNLILLFRAFHFDKVPPENIPSNVKQNQDNQAGLLSLPITPLWAILKV